MSKTFKTLMAIGNQGIVLVWFIHIEFGLRVMTISSFPWCRTAFLGNILFRSVRFKYWGGKGAPIFTVYFFLWVMLWGLCFSHLFLEWITLTFGTWVLPSSRFYALMPMGIEFHSYINASHWWGSIWHTYSTQKVLKYASD